MARRTLLLCVLVAGSQAAAGCCNRRPFNGRFAGWGPYAPPAAAPAYPAPVSAGPGVAGPGYPGPECSSCFAAPASGPPPVVPAVPAQLPPPAGAMSFTPAPLGTFDGLPPVLPGPPATVIPPPRVYPSTAPNPMPSGGAK